MPNSRGYPEFAGSTPPAGHIQMAQLAQAIAADVQTLYNVDPSPITSSNPGLYGPLPGFQAPAIRRIGKRRELVGVITNITPISFAGGSTYAVYLLDPADRPPRSEIMPAAAGSRATAGVTIRSSGVIDFALPADITNAPVNNWYLSLSGIAWYTA